MLESLLEPISCTLATCYWDGEDENARRIQFKKDSNLSSKRNRCFAAIVSRKLLCPPILVNADLNSKIGLFCSGGPHHSQTSWKFLNDVYSEGEEFVSPLLFPNTINSSVPSSAANAWLSDISSSQLSPFQFVLTLGTDEFSTFLAIKHSCQLLLERRIDVAVVLSVFDADLITSRAMLESNKLRKPKSCGVGIRLTIGHHPERHVVLTHLYEEDHGSNELDSSLVREDATYLNKIESKTNLLTSTYNSALVKDDVFTASIGLTFKEAIELSANKTTDSTAFAGLSINGRAKGLLFKHSL